MSALYPSVALLHDAAPLQSGSAVAAQRSNGRTAADGSSRSSRLQTAETSAVAVAAAAAAAAAAAVAASPSRPRSTLHGEMR